MTNTNKQVKNTIKNNVKKANKEVNANNFLQDNTKIDFAVISKEDIKQHTLSLVNNIKDNQKNLHLLACQCLAHFYQYGDYTLLTDLIDKLPKAIRKSDLLFWSVHFGAFTYDVKNGLQYDKEKMQDNKAKYIDILNNAFKNPFFELRKDKPVITKTFLDILKELEKSLVYDLNKRKNSRYNVNDLQDIRSLISKREKVEDKEVKEVKQDIKEVEVIKEVKQNKNTKNTKNSNLKKVALKSGDFCYTVA